MTEAVRLAKRVVELFSCSRREAELYIEGGWVQVDGVVVEEPQFRVLQQQVELHPRANLNPPDPVTLILNKPAGFDYGDGPKPAAALIQASSQFIGDKSGILVLKRNISKLSPTLVWDTEASGLVVFTKNRQVIRKLVEDGSKIEQELIVEVSGQIEPDGLTRLAQGLTYNRRVLAACNVSWQNETRLRFAIKNVYPGQIQFMCSQVGLTVVSMKRIRIGRIAMSNLPLGQWRFLQQRF